MTGDVTQFINLKLKAEGHVTYGDNNRGKILGKGDVVMEEGQAQPFMKGKNQVKNVQDQARSV